MNPVLGPITTRKRGHSVVSGFADREPVVGLLAVQGDFAMHRAMVTSLGYECAEVRTVEQLQRVDCLIMPGGESTTMRKILKAEGLFDAIREFGKYHAIMGTCAGLILLGQRIQGGEDWEDTLGLIDIDSDRNAYGRQFHSFRASGTSDISGVTKPLEMVFIRAPRITRIGVGVEILARLGDEPTMVRQDNVLGLTFHPEMGEDGSVHGFFIGQMAARAMQQV